eukprot:TRINITY_DN27304_c0_g1_i1.p1 TRINITY_DN27304_c0_g1~~TRINITY_DN27304_c0_g1_i1.p1  ORF type:complete len:182 (-),score=40.93 TRINITY_DN27304_c0_g1_i1:103-648(-)
MIGTANIHVLSQFNASFHLSLELAALVGPIIVSVALQLHHSYANYVIVFFYVLALLIYCLLPPLKVPDEARTKTSKPNKSNCQDWLQPCRLVVTPYILVPFIAVCATRGQTLKSIVAAVYAKSLLGEEGGQSTGYVVAAQSAGALLGLSLIHISEPTRLLSISYAVFCLKKKKKKKEAQEY